MMPEGFKNISPMPWKHEVGHEYECDDDGGRGDVVNRVKHAGWNDRIWDTVCDDVAYYPAHVRPEDQALIASAPDHALLLAAITRGVVNANSAGLFIISKEAKGQSAVDGKIYWHTLDPFGCPILTDECRAAIINALEAE